ncbi:hypothetical protein ZWY2020_018990 [Hordeum vulgare]|nr:hypothetical protein ZWY2020_047254 [Hordeum vulgare]KAI4986360.1 hypothetical protein ZWY2020_018990 [Hordeum vulgare]
MDKQSIEGLHQAMELVLAPRLPTVHRAKWILVHAAGQQALVMTALADDRQAGRIPATKAKATSAMHFHDVVEAEVHHFGQESYALMKANVDDLKPIQVGIAWEFNLRDLYRLADLTRRGLYVDTLGTLLMGSSDKGGCRGSPTMVPTT